MKIVSQFPTAILPPVDKGKVVQLNGIITFRNNLTQRWKCTNIKITSENNHSLSF